LDLQLTLLVLLAAFMHAVWNTFVKSSRDRLVELTLVNVVSGLIAACALPWVGTPDPASWGYILASIIIHTAYYIFLILAYRVGDLSHVYPLARGVSPLIVALLSGIVAGEVLNDGQLAAVVLISASVASLALIGRWQQREHLKPVLLALGTGCTIAGYTLVDGTGVRLSGNALAYIAWLFALDCLPLLAITLVLRRGAIGQTLRGQWRTGVLGGMLALSAYGLVIWALSLGAMAPIAALRETSVIIAALIGALFLGEPFGRRRALAAAGVAIGVIMLGATAS
jgi:drug/metabolite transporter (DMT)-like permease